LPCDRPVVLFGGASATAPGVKLKGRNDFAARLETLFRRACRGKVDFQLVAGRGHDLLEDADAILARIAAAPSSLLIMHYPTSDVADGAAVPVMVGTYERILDACHAQGGLCLIGGQLPVDQFTAGLSSRQLELERIAMERFGSAYVALYRHFQSERGQKRLMTRLDSGDGRHLNDFGHELLHELYARALIRLAGTGK